MSLPARLANGRINPAALRLILEIILVLALAVQAGRIVSNLLAPVGPIGYAATPRDGVADLTVFSRFNAFEPRGDGGPITQSGGEGVLTLFGVRADGVGGGSAIIGEVGGRQMAYSVGETLPSGGRLKSVGADFAVLSNGAKLQLIRSSAPVSAGAPAYLATPALTAPPTASPAVNPKQFIAEAGLRPRVEDGRITGYSLTPRAGGETLRRAGLAAGDIITQINGATLTAEKLGELESELASNPSVQITVERDGAPRTLTLQTGGQTR